MGRARHLLSFHHLTELIGFTGLALASDFGRWLKQAEELAFTARVAAEEACPGLFHHLPDTRRHLIEFLSPPTYGRAVAGGESLRAIAAGLEERGIPAARGASGPLSKWRGCWRRPAALSPAQASPLHNRKVRALTRNCVCATVGSDSVPRRPVRSLGLGCCRRSMFAKQKAPPE